MKTAIIVLNYNDYNNTKKYVEAIKEYNIIDKIVVVDNNSSDGNTENLKKINDDKIDVIFAAQNGGYAYGNNFGLKYLDEKYPNKYEYVIISNPDVSVEENSIKECINLLSKNENVAIVAPRMKYINGTSRRSCWKRRDFLVDIANSTRITEILFYPLFKKGKYSKNDFNTKVLKVHAIAGSFFVVKHDIFKQIGYFDENTFLFFEEDIIADKIKEAGYDICSLNYISFIHYDSQCIGKLMSAFKKVDILFDSKKYYHKTYNNVGKVGLVILEVLRYIRKLEMLIEIPVRKLFKR